MQTQSFPLFAKRKPRQSSRSRDPSQECSSLRSPPETMTGIPPLSPLSHFIAHALPHRPVCTLAPTAPPTVQTRLNEPAAARAAAWDSDGNTWRTLRPRVAAASHGGDCVGQRGNQRAFAAAARSVWHRSCPARGTRRNAFRSWRPRTSISIS